MDPQTQATAPLLPEGAFVVQFREGTDLKRGPVTGRVEHVVSGQTGRFGSLEELTAFFTHVLSTLPPSSVLPEPGARMGA
jgi:hypothetical protein